MGWGGSNKQLPEAQKTFRSGVRCSLRNEAEVFISPDMRLTAVLRQFCSGEGWGMCFGVH